MVWPRPWHVGQGSLISVPVPPHWGHGWEIENSPWPCDSMPRPWQRGHTVGLVPGFAPVPWHVGHDEGTCAATGTCAPSIACSHEMWTSLPMSRPRSGPGLRAARPPPPARSDRMSPKPPKPPPPPGPPPVRNAPGSNPPPKKPPPWSYCLRFSGSDSTAYACWISLKRSSAFSSPWLVSGWYLRASLRYAFLISSAEAFLSTPRVLYGSLGAAIY